ncbi:hypothetical protein [Cupriavidus agavae]|uniref:Uncharacterized protein n=1 Tax=Cupriavidus agavae TaxID=1001822 RepID=A0A4Q7S5R9_9BURK|nr:hypothetical protein [Cupriavidus agavae]RZT41048.1 hypothetical protein EV147_0033 [Cupriavidus agavae]
MTATKSGARYVLQALLQAEKETAARRVFWTRRADEYIPPPGGREMSPGRRPMARLSRQRDAMDDMRRGRGAAGRADEGRQSWQSPSG